MCTRIFAVILTFNKTQAKKKPPSPRENEDLKLLLVFFNLPSNRYVFLKQKTNPIWKPSSKMYIFRFFSRVLFFWYIFAHKHTHIDTWPSFA